MTTPSIDPKVLGELIAAIEKYESFNSLSNGDRVVHKAVAAKPHLLALQSALSVPVAEQIKEALERLRTENSSLFAGLGIWEEDFETLATLIATELPIIIATEGR